MSLDLHYWILGLSLAAAFGAGAGAVLGVFAWLRLRRIELYFNGKGDRDAEH